MILTRVLGISTGALAIAAAATFVWGNGWKKTATGLQAWQGTMVLAVQQASGNPKADEHTAAGQVIAMGDSIGRLKVSISEQNASIDAMARAAVAASRERAELTRLLAKAKAQRSAALRRLSDLSITPGTRSDCLQLLREAEEATDILRDAAKETEI